MTDRTDSTRFLIVSNIPLRITSGHSRCSPWEFRHAVRCPVCQCWVTREFWTDHPHVRRCDVCDKNPAIPGGAGACTPCFWWGVGMRNLYVSPCFLCSGEHKGKDCRRQAHALMDQWDELLRRLAD